MADEEPAPDAESVVAPRPKRPVPTIDLIATHIPDAAPASAGPAGATDPASVAPATAEPPASADPAQPGNPAQPGDPAKPADAATSDNAATPSNAAKAGERGEPSEPDRPAAAPPPSRGSSWAHLAAGVAGAALVLGVLGVLFVIGMIELPGDVTPSPRLAWLEAQLRELAARPQPAPSAAPSPQATSDGSPRGDTKALDELSARLARAEAALAAPRPPAVDPALTARVGTLEAALQTISDNLAALHRQSDDIATGLRETRERGETARGEAASKALADASKATADASKALADVERLSQRIAALERADKSLQDELATKSDRPSDRAVRLAVTASALKSAVDHGEPFAAELLAARPLAADPALLEPLAPFADAGLPSAAALARELSALVPALQRQADAAPRAGGIFDRLQASAGRLVQIRPSGEAPGDDPPTVIARIEAAAGRIDLSGALAEFAKLPPAMRTPADAWIGKVQAREAALAAAQRFTAETFAALGKS